MEKKSEKLINILRSEKMVFIQTHDFPDPDAIAAAFGLQFFLKQKGIASDILYEGELQTNPVERMIRDFGISMKYTDQVNLTAEDKIIIVDGCKGNKNVTNEKGKVIAVIDHHQGEKPKDLLFTDVRAGYGSCSTIISLYLQENKIKLISDVATVLAIGIHVDTNSFRRMIHPADIKAFSFLLDSIDHNLLGSILRNNIFQKELIIYQKALNDVRINQKFAFYYYSDECSQNLLGILADFFLSINEVEFVVLCAQSNNKIIFSIRSENLKWNAAFIVKTALEGLGAGGGHKDMAGGVIKGVSLFNEQEIYQRFTNLLSISNY